MIPILLIMLTLNNNMSPIKAYKNDTSYPIVPRDHHNTSTRRRLPFDPTIKTGFGERGIDGGAQGAQWAKNGAGLEVFKKRATKQTEDPAHLGTQMDLFAQEIFSDVMGDIIMHNIMPSLFQHSYSRFVHFPYYFENEGHGAWYYYRPFWPKMKRLDGWTVADFSRITVRNIQQVAVITLVDLIVGNNDRFFINLPDYRRGNPNTGNLMYTIHGSEAHGIIEIDPIDNGFGNVWVMGGLHANTGYFADFIGNMQNAAKSLIRTNNEYKNTRMFFKKKLFLTIQRRRDVANIILHTWITQGDAICDTIKHILSTDAVAVLARMEHEGATAQSLSDIRKYLTLVKDHILIFKDRHNARRDPATQPVTWEDEHPAFAAKIDVGSNNVYDNNIDGQNDLVFPYNSDDNFYPYINGFDNYIYVVFITLMILLLICVGSFGICFCCFAFGYGAKTVMAKQTSLYEI
eukprot:28963_1